MTFLPGNIDGATCNLVGSIDPIGLIKFFFYIDLKFKKNKNYLGEMTIDPITINFFTYMKLSGVNITNTILNDVFIHFSKCKVKLCNPKG